MNKERWNRNDPYSEGIPYALSLPYRVPESEMIPPVRTAEVWVEKNCLVVPKDWESPPVCLLNGAATDLLPKRRTWLTWVNPAWYFLICILGFFALLLVALLQKTGRIHYYISHATAAKIRKRLIINWCFFAVGLLTVMMAFPYFGGDFSSWLLVPGITLLVLSGVLAASWCRPFYARKMSHTHIWIAKIPTHVREAIVEMEKTAASRPWM